MEKAEILKRVDHTLLAQEAGWAEIREVLDDAVFIILLQRVYRLRLSGGRQSMYRESCRSVR